QVLAEARLVVLDERVGGVENVAVRAIVLLELDERDRHALALEIALEMLHVGDVRAAERVDRLVVVADGEHGSVLPGEELQPSILEDVRVLELVDEEMGETAAVMLAEAVALRE